jgi:hypothetical protein
VGYWHRAFCRFVKWLIFYNLLGSICIFFIFREMGTGRQVFRTWCPSFRRAQLRRLATKARLAQLGHFVKENVDMCRGRHLAGAWVAAGNGNHDGGGGAAQSAKSKVPSMERPNLSASQRTEPSSRHHGPRSLNFSAVFATLSLPVQEPSPMPGDGFDRFGTHA